MDYHFGIVSCKLFTMNRGGHSAFLGFECLPVLIDIEEYIIVYITNSSNISCASMA